METADKQMLLNQLNQLMSEAAGDAETMAMYKEKLAQLDQMRQMNLQLTAALERERARASSAETRLASVAQDAESAARAIGDQMVREKAAKESLEAQAGALHGEVAHHRNEALGARADAERLRLDVERLRGDLDASRERAMLAEERASEAHKILHVMRAEAQAAAQARADLEAKVRSLADSVARVRHFETEASAARCALDTEVAALSHAVQQANAAPPPLAPAPKATHVPPMPRKLPAFPDVGAPAATGASRPSSAPRSARGRVQ